MTTKFHANLVQASRVCRKFHIKKQHKLYAVTVMSTHCNHDFVTAKKDDII